MNYHYVSVTDLTRYVRRLSNFFPSIEAFITDVEETIQQLKESEDNYDDEIRFYERVINKLLTEINKEKLGKTKKK